MLCNAIAFSLMQVWMTHRMLKYVIKRRRFVNTLRHCFNKLGGGTVYLSSAVTSFLSPRGFPPSTLRTLMRVRCNLVSLSSGFSAAVILRSRVPFRCRVACLSLAVWAARLARSLSLRFLSFSLLCSAICAGRRILSLSFPRRVSDLLPTSSSCARWFENSSRTALGIHVQQNL